MSLLPGIFPHSTAAKNWVSEDCLTRHLAKHGGEWDDIKDLAEKAKNAMEKGKHVTILTDDCLHALEKYDKAKLAALYTQKALSPTEGDLLKCLLDPVPGQVGGRETLFRWSHLYYDNKVAVTTTVDNKIVTCHKMSKLKSITNRITTSRGWEKIIYPNGSPEPTTHIITRSLELPTGGG